MIDGVWKLFDGGGLLQKCDRDALGFAMKCSSVNIEGTWIDVQKLPATDPTKSSKPGRLVLVEDENCGLTTVRRD
jgi:nicotinamide phosphoribosyltransferase